MKDAEIEKLRGIIRGYACNLQAQLKHEGDDGFDYVRNAEIEFPLSLLHDVHRELQFRGAETFPGLEKYGLFNDFNLKELVRHFKPDFGRMGCLTNYNIDEITNVRIIGKRVHLDVTVKASSSL